VKTHNARLDRVASPYRREAAGRLRPKTEEPSHPHLARYEARAASHAPDTHRSDNVTVSGSAGRGDRPANAHHPRKSRQSASYALSVFADLVDERRSSITRRNLFTSTPKSSNRQSCSCSISRRHGSSHKAPGKLPCSQGINMPPARGKKGGNFEDQRATHEPAQHSAGSTKRDDLHVIGNHHVWTANTFGGPGSSRMTFVSGTIWQFFRSQPSGASCANRDQYFGSVRNSAAT